MRNIKSQGGFNIKRQGGWVQWVAAAIGAVGLIADLVGSGKASSASKKQAREEARIERLLTAERIRQIDIEERAQYGETLSGYAGGGVLAAQPTLERASPITGSPLTIIAEQARERAYERSITRSAGASRVQQALQGGKATADEYKYEGYGRAASSLSDIISSEFWKG